jgi:hypothetical protein
LHAGRSRNQIDDIAEQQNEAQATNKGETNQAARPIFAARIPEAQQPLFASLQRKGRRNVVSRIFIVHSITVSRPSMASTLVPVIRSFRATDDDRLCDRCSRERPLSYSRWRETFTPIVNFAWGFITPCGAVPLA